MNIKKLLGKRIREIRKLKQYTQEQVAELMNIETTSLSNIENGKYFPTAENIEKILKILNISAETLFLIEHNQSQEELENEITLLIKKHPDKLKDIYKIIKAIVE